MLHAIQPESDHDSKKMSEIWSIRLLYNRITTSMRWRESPMSGDNVEKCLVQ